MIVCFTISCVTAAFRHHSLLSHQSHLLCLCLEVFISVNHIILLMILIVIMQNVVSSVLLTLLLMMMRPHMDGALAVVSFIKLPVVVKSGREHEHVVSLSGLLGSLVSLLSA